MNNPERPKLPFDQERDVLCCRSCSNNFVTIRDWEESPMRNGVYMWKLVLFCSDCVESDTRIVSEEVVNNWDEEYEEGSRQLAKSLDEFVALVIIDEVIQLRTALDKELILPEDF